MTAFNICFLSWVIQNIWRIFTHYGDTKCSHYYLDNNWCSCLTLLIWFHYPIHSEQTTNKHNIGGSHLLWFTLLVCTHHLRVCIWCYSLSPFTKVIFFEIKLFCSIAQQNLGYYHLKLNTVNLLIKFNIYGQRAVKNL